MANIFAIHSVGESLRVFLQSTYPQALQDTYPCSFQVLSSGQLSQFEDPTESNVALTLYLYRTTISEHNRNRLQPRSRDPNAPALPLELHWMITVWAASAAAEHAVFAWTLRQLNGQQVVDASMLTPEAEWHEGDQLHLIPEELAIEDMMRVWDALEPSYRLSASFVTRVVRIDAELPDTPPRVMAARFSIATGSDAEQAEEEGP